MWNNGKALKGRNPNPKYISRHILHYIFSKMPKTLVERFSFRDVPVD